MKSTIIALLFVLVGCGSALNPVSPPAVNAAGPQVFPAITSAGTTITLEPGTYSCPTGVLAGTHIVGHGAVVPPELLADSTFAPLPPGAPIVRILCSSDLTLSTLAGLDISGVVFDFQNVGGLILDDVAWSRFDMGIVNSTTALTMESHNTENAGNTFPRVIIYKTNTGILLQGFNSTAVTWNDFGHVDIVRARDFGIDVSQFTDTNTFGSVRIRMNATGIDGIVFNDHAALTDVDAGGNVFHLINCDGDAGFVGFCADFRGNIVGNKITMGYGIMAEANKIHFDNAFTQGATIVSQLQEHPNLP
jgi:hypothetical protein